MKPPTPVQIATYGQEIGLPFEECEAFFDHFEANGWKVGGKTAMKSWEAALRTWKRNWMKGIFGNHRGHELSGADKMILQKELERCIEKMKALRSTYGDHQSWTDADRNYFKKCRDRAAEIRAKLGITL